MLFQKLILLLLIAICFVQNVAAQKGGTIAYVRDGFRAKAQRVQRKNQLNFASFAPLRENYLTIVGTL